MVFQLFPHVALAGSGASIDMVQQGMADAVPVQAQVASQVALSTPAPPMPTPLPGMVVPTPIPVSRGRVEPTPAPLPSPEYMRPLEAFDRGDGGKLADHPHSLLR